ncbi:serine--tRNA ligase, mitochondrial-like [Daphnia carinata]|uniref:serine--tRNA ligase, mitochondrial-like n=1 Tax=Daphnia carinata TaxID=120202 RepID=UPI00257FCB6C|nr:serine--tRNA ligase, mitochondrial-like [Daphnia carinata]
MIMALRILSTSHIKIPIKKHLLCIVRGVVSALHIPGHISKAAVSILTPDLSHIEALITEDIAQLQNNLSARNSSFHLDSFLGQWRQMTALRLQREDLESRRVEVTQMMKQVVTNATGSSDTRNVEDIKRKGIELRTQLKELTKLWWEIEEIAVTRALSLPNYLHCKTPIEDNTEVYSFMPEKSDLNCLGDCTEENIKFASHSRTAFYLKGTPANLELRWMQTFSKDWIDNGYNLISAPDFVRSLIIDGCGLAFNDQKEVLSLATIQDHGSLEKGNGLHLVGGSSLPAMVAFLTKTVIEEPFPLRLVSVGRCYQPVTGILGANDLANTMQSSSIRLLTVMENCPDALFQELVFIQHQISKQLEQLNVNVRIIATAARNLEPWEQYRSSIELYSSSSKKYVQVANVSIIGDYICRRLSIYGPDKEFPGFVTAQALSVPKLLACYLE